MKVLKKSGGKVWYQYLDYSFKVENKNDGNSIIWINYHNMNIAFPMMMRDFFSKMDDIGITVMVNSDWENHKGFEVEEKDVEFLIGEIINFCIDNDANTMQSKDNYTTQEWYE